MYVLQKIFASHIPDDNVKVNIYKELTQFNSMKRYHLMICSPNSSPNDAEEETRRAGAFGATTATDTGFGNLTEKTSDKSHTVEGMSLLERWKIHTFRTEWIHVVLTELRFFKSFESHFSCLNFSYPLK